MTDKYLIWWLNSGDECDLVMSIQTDKKIIPAYLMGEVVSLYGRAPRGRLWVPENIDVHSIVDPHGLFEEPYFDKRGGIVFHAKDLPIVRTLPGFVTTLSVDLLSVETV